MIGYCLQSALRGPTIRVRRVALGSSENSIAAITTAVSTFRAFITRCWSDVRSEWDTATSFLVSDARIADATSALRDSSERSECARGQPRALLRA